MALFVPILDLPCACLLFTVRHMLSHGIEFTDTNWRSIDKAYYRYRKVLANERHLMENL